MWRTSFSIFLPAPVLHAIGEMAAQSYNWNSQCDRFASSSLGGRKSTSNKCCILLLWVCDVLIKHSLWAVSSCYSYISISFTTIFVWCAGIDREIRCLINATTLSNDLLNGATPSISFSMAASSAAARRLWSLEPRPVHLPCQ